MTTAQRVARHRKNQTTELARLRAEMETARDAGLEQAACWHDARVIALNGYDQKEHDNPAPGSGERKSLNAITRNVHLNAADAIRALKSR
jgi:hypothetical protein